ncbi:nuclear transport factor 2 family protein [Nonomuraea sp. NPDC000554]|uniref:nuclear transport factor 2 family protein n=1 Tax=Nonomuraea sp. NPDC000554 TaxID=3154259 RepID=UPI0033283879
MRAREVAEEILRVSKGGDTSGFLDLLAPDVVLEWPYHPPGVPDVLRGREEIRAFMGGGLPVTFHDHRDVVIHETADPEVVVMEYTAHGTVVASGAPFTQRVIAVIRVRDGQIVHYRDYINPLVLMEALAGHTQRTT